MSECVSVAYTHLGAWTQVGMHIFRACGYITRILCVTMKKKTSKNAMSDEFQLKTPVQVGVGW